jgi:hypothetical protein
MSNDQANGETTATNAPVQAGELKLQMVSERAGEELPT